MKKKGIVFFSVFLLTVSFFPFSVFASDLRFSLASMVDKDARSDPSINGCTFSPEVIYYKGQRINYGSACDDHDRAYNRQDDRFAADLKLGRDIANILIRNGVPAEDANKIGALYSAAAHLLGESFYRAAGQRK